MEPARPSQRDPWLAPAILLAAAWWIFDLAVLRAGVPDRLDDTWEYGVAARTLLAGHGFRTLVIHPPLWPLRDASFTVPLLIHGPLVPALLAPFLAGLGPRALDGIAWLGALGALAAVPPIVRLGARCGGSAVGFAAAMLWTLAPLTLRAVNHDAALTLGAALAIAAFELATRATPRAAPAGVAIGLAALVRPELLFALPVLAALSDRGGLRLLTAGALALLPWWIHHTLAVGQPFFNLSVYLMLGYWEPHPGLAVLRDFTLTPDRFRAVLAASWGDLVPKWREFLPHALKSALLVPTAATGWLAALGALFAVRERGSRALAIAALALASIPVAIMTVTLYDDRYLTPLLPLWALGAARGLHELARRLPGPAGRAPAWIGALALAVAPAVVPLALAQAREARGLETRLTGERARLGAWAAEASPAPPGPAGASGRPSRSTGPVFSDTPDFVAWTIRRPAIWVTLPEYARLPAREDGSGRPPRTGQAGEAYFHPDEPGLAR